MSGSDTNRSPADVRFTSAGVGHGDMRRMFTICNHKGSTAGAQYVRGLGYLRCATCNAARLAAKETT